MRSNCLRHPTESDLTWDPRGLGAKGCSGWLVCAGGLADELLPAGKGQEIGGFEWREPVVEGSESCFTMIESKLTILDGSCLL